MSSEHLWGENKSNVSYQASQCFVTPIEKWWALRLCHQFDLLLLLSATQCPAIDLTSQQMQTNLKPHYGNNQSGSRRSIVIAFKWVRVHQCSSLSLSLYGWGMCGKPATLQAHVNIKKSTDVRHKSGFLCIKNRRHCQWQPPKWKEYVLKYNIQSRQNMYWLLQDCPSGSRL